MVARGRDASRAPCVDFLVVTTKVTDDNSRVFRACTSNVYARFMSCIVVLFVVEFVVFKRGYGMEIGRRDLSSSLRDRN